MSGHVTNPSYFISFVKRGDREKVAGLAYNPSRTRMSRQVEVLSSRGVDEEEEKEQQLEIGPRNARNVVAVRTASSSVAGNLEAPALCLLSPAHDIASPSDMLTGKGTATDGSGSNRRFSLPLSCVKVKRKIAPYIHRMSLADVLVEHSDWSTCGIGERWDIAAMAKYMQDHSEESSKLGLCPLNMGLNGIIQDGGSPQPSPSPESPRDKSMELNSPHVHFLVPNVPHETFEENMEVACPEANNSGTRKRRISFLKRSGTVKKRSDEKDGILLRPRSHSAGVLNKGDGQEMSASQTAESPMSSSQPDLTDLGRQTRKKSRSFASPPSVEARCGADWAVFLSFCAHSAKEMRSKLAFLRKRPAASVSIHVEDMSANTDRVQRLEVEQVTRWSESFEALLNDKCGVQAFHGYLKTEFSEENLEFWMACEEYKQLKPSKQAHRAKKIYNDYIAVQAPRELNLDAEARAETLARLTSPDEGTFKLAQRKIAILMERDSYPRFLRSNLYQALRSQNNTSQILNLTR
ncbi:Regulator of G-protein signaling 4 [Branchiostoma belcheri]|nr:Regulator of G-protein signaling 4 [Branchiostoma belcheri]